MCLHLKRKDQHGHPGGQKPSELSINQHHCWQLCKCHSQSQSRDPVTNWHSASSAKTDFQSKKNLRLKINNFKEIVQLKMSILFINTFCLYYLYDVPNLSAVVYLTVHHKRIILKNFPLCVTTNCQNPQRTTKQCKEDTIKVQCICLVLCILCQISDK